MRREPIAAGFEGPVGAGRRPHIVGSPHTSCGPARGGGEPHPARPCAGRRSSFDFRGL